VKDLPERLAYAAARIPYVHVVTNGLAMTPALAEAIIASGVREVSVSIDGDKDFHNAIRGREDAFDKAWDALELFDKGIPKIHVVVNSLLTPWSVEPLERLSKLLEAFPKVKRKYLPVSKHALFKGADLGALKALPCQQSGEERLAAFIDAAARDPKVVNSKAFLKKAKLFLCEGKERLLDEQANCLYPRHAIEFGPDGRAYPCITGMEFKNGIAPERDLAEFLSSGEYANLQARLAKCRRCDGAMPLCYYEPRLNFPIHNLLRSMLG